MPADECPLSLSLSPPPPPPPAPGMAAGGGEGGCSPGQIWGWWSDGDWWPVFLRFVYQKRGSGCAHLQAVLYLKLSLVILWAQYHVCEMADAELLWEVWSPLCFAHSLLTGDLPVCAGSAAFQHSISSVNCFPPHRSLPGALIGNPAPKGKLRQSCGKAAACWAPGCLELIWQLQVGGLGYCDELVDCTLQSVKGLLSASLLWTLFPASTLAWKRKL